MPDQPAIPRTEAGRRMLDDYEGWRTKDETRHAILAIEAEAASLPAPDGALRAAGVRYRLYGGSMVPDSEGQWVQLDPLSEPRIFGTYEEFISRAEPRSEDGG